jgi:SAM-dependent MidA family methyltransferase
VNASILAHPGQQDLTALVDFTALVHSAQRAQFSIVAILRQANFLLGLGLGTTHTPETVIQSGNLDEFMQYRKGLHSLIFMEGLGRFHVLLLAKGVDVGSAEHVLSALKYASF